MNFRSCQPPPPRGSWQFVKSAREKGKAKVYTPQLPRDKSPQIPFSLALVWLHYLQGNQTTHKSAVFAGQEPQIYGSAFPLLIETLMICLLLPGVYKINVSGAIYQCVQATPAGIVEVVTWQDLYVAIAVNPPGGFHGSAVRWGWRQEPPPQQMGGATGGGAHGGFGMITTGIGCARAQPIVNPVDRKRKRGEKSTASLVFCPPISIRIWQHLLNSPGNRVPGVAYPPPLCTTSTDCPTVPFFLNNQVILWAPSGTVPHWCHWGVAVTRF